MGHIDTTATTRRGSDGVAAIAGLVVLVAGMTVVRDGSVPAAEEALFHAVNDLPDLLYPVLWPFQQLGAVLVGPAVAIVAALARRFGLAAGALTATAGKLALERLVKLMVSRQRPGTSVGPEVDLRGDVSSAGESFVSGHAVLVTALAAVVAAHLPGRWRLVPWVVAALVMVTRVYVGAHLPLDVVCGAGLGLAIGATVNLVLGVPGRAGRADGPVEE